MCYVFVIYILQPTNCKLTADFFSAAKPATQVLSKLITASISVRFSCTNVFALPVHMFAANNFIS